MHAYIHTYMHTYIHTCMHAYIHTYIHTCTHSYIHGGMNLTTPKTLEQNKITKTKKSAALSFGEVVGDMKS